MTRTPVNGGGEVAMKVGTASLALSPGHGREEKKNMFWTLLVRAAARHVIYSYLSLGAWRYQAPHICTFQSHQSSRQLIPIYIAKLIKYYSQWIIQASILGKPDICTCICQPCDTVLTKGNSTVLSSLSGHVKASKPLGVLTQFL